MRYAPNCDHCGEHIDGAWYRPAYTEVWLCWDCNDKDLKKYQVTREEWEEGDR